MKRLLAIAFLAGVVIPSDLVAQFRSAPRSMGYSSLRMPRTFAPVRPMPGAVRPGLMRPAWVRPGLFGGWGPGFGHPFFFRRRPFIIIPSPFFSSFSSFAYQPFFPYQWPPLDYQYQQARQIARGDETGEIAAQQNNLLASQLQALTDEIRSLREEQVSRAYQQEPAATPRSAPEEKFIPAVFVYHDGHQLEAQNYAILGQTLWVFTDEVARKIPLAEINLPLTRKLNAERGIELTLPRLN